MTQLYLASPASEFAGGQVRGACPTLREPMRTGDGLLARLRPVGGALSPAQLHHIAALASRHGNGQIEITARGNLQVRGLQAHTVPDFAAAIEDLIPIETGVPIEISPLSGLDPDETADARPIGEALRAALIGTPPPAPLGPKVTVVIDGRGTIMLDDLASDVGLRALGPALWAISIGGRPIGAASSAHAADAVLSLLSMIAVLGPRGRGRDLDLGAARQRLKLPTVDEPLPAPARARSTAQTALRDGRIAVAITLPFGAANASSLLALSNVAQAFAITELRLAPQHGLIALCASAIAADQFRAAASALGFLSDPTDPRRSIHACIGSQGCASGLLPARQIAETLAHLDPDFFDGSFAFHVSGCAKGCAHPGSTLLGLVGADTGMGLVIRDSVKAPPTLSLPPDGATAIVHRLATLWRDNRGLGESVASCFKRLGAARITAAARQG